jgi:hypothetical protein
VDDGALLGVVLQSEYCHAECRSAKRRCAECRGTNLKRRPENLRFQRIVNQPNRPQLKFGAKERNVHASDFVAILLRF